MPDTAPDFAAARALPDAERTMIYACGTLNGLVDEGFLQAKSHTLSERGEAIYRALRRMVDAGEWAPERGRLLACIDALRQPAPPLDN